MVKATGTQKTTMGLEARGNMISTSGSAIVSHLWQHVYIHSNSEDKQSHPGEAPDQKGLLGLYKVRPPWPCKMWQCSNRMMSAVLKSLEDLFWLASSH